MLPTSAAKAPNPKAGFTLLEMLVVLAVMSLAAAIALPMTTRALDGVSGQAVMFDFQRQVLDLRAQAYRNQVPVRLQTTAPPAGDDQEPTPIKLDLPLGWTYSLSGPVDIDTLGGCSAGRVDLMRGGVVRLSLRNVAGDCHFQRS